MVRGVQKFSLLFFGIVWILSSCNTQSDKSNNDASSMKFKQYYVQGEQLYTKHCSNCHQKDGKGLGRIYPPLDSSDYMQQNFNDVICLMRYGASGEMIVNGKSFNQPMPGIPSLSDLEIAEIATYIYNTWSHKKGLIDVTQVSNIQQKCNMPQAE